MGFLFSRRLKRKWDDRHVNISDIEVRDPSGGMVALGNMISVPTIVVIARYFG